MKRDQYMGLDVHQATTVVSVIDAEGKRVLETMVATEAGPLRRLMDSMSGPLHVTLEECGQAAWVHEVVRTQVAEVVVCDPRRNKLLLDGSKADRVDARKLAELLRGGLLRSVYHGHEETRTLKQLVRAYETFSVDTNRAMVRIKALYRGRGIRTPGSSVYQEKQRSEWLKQLADPGMQQRAEWLYAQLDQVRQLRKQAKAGVVSEGRRHDAVRLLRTIPQLGPVRAALIVATADTPYRFRTKRQFWAYSGLAVVTHASAEYVLDQDQLVRRRKPAATRGLNRNCNRRLKSVFITAATAGVHTELYRAYLDSLQQRGIRPEMARLTLARKIATLALTLWKKGETFDPEKVNWTI